MNSNWEVMFVFLLVTQKRSLKKKIYLCLADILYVQLFLVNIVFALDCFNIKCIVEDVLWYIGVCSPQAGYCLGCDAIGVRLRVRNAHSKAAPTIHPRTCRSSWWWWRSGWINLKMHKCTNAFYNKIAYSMGLCNYWNPFLYLTNFFSECWPPTPTHKIPEIFISDSLSELIYP